MKELLNQFKTKIVGAEPKRQAVPDVIEASVSEHADRMLKLKLLILESYSDTEDILNLLRDGDTMVVVKINALREKDMNELKRAINRMKTHCAATGAQMAALDDSWIIIVPPTVELEHSLLGKISK